MSWHVLINFTYLANVKRGGFIEKKRMCEREIDRAGKQYGVEKGLEYT